MKRELYFKSGVEGGGQTLYRITKGGEIIGFIEEGSAMGLDEEDGEEWQFWQRPYISWEDFWHRFTRHPDWVYHVPLHVHEDARDSLRNSLTKIKKPRKGNFQYYYFWGWVEAIETGGRRYEAKPD